MAAPKTHKSQQEQRVESQPKTLVVLGSADVLAFLVLVILGLPALVVFAAFVRQFVSSALFWVASS
jgi:hypothetical protein